MALNEQKSIDASIVFGIVGHLSILSKHNLSVWSHQTQIAHIDLDKKQTSISAFKKKKQPNLDNRSLCNHSQRRKSLRRRIFLHSNNVQKERRYFVFFLVCLEKHHNRKIKKPFKSGCVTCAFLKRNPVGRMNRSYFGGLRTKLSPTNVTFVTIRFHCFFFRFPVLTTRNISSSEMGLTRGRGTFHFPAFSLRFCFNELDRT